LRLRMSNTKTPKRWAAEKVDIILHGELEHFEIDVGGVAVKETDVRPVVLQVVCDEVAIECAS